MCDIGRFDYHWIEGDDRLQPSAAAHRGRHARADGLARTRSTKLADRVTAAGGAGGAPLPGLGARVARGAVRRSAGSAARSDVPEDGVACQLAHAREAAAAQRRSSRFPPIDAPNVNGAQRPRLPGAARRATGDADLSAFRAQVEAGQRHGAVRLRSRARTARSATSSWIIEARKSGKLPLLIVQGVLHDRAREGGRHRAARRRVGREGRGLHEHAGPAAGRVARDRAAGRSAGRLADLRERRRSRSARR